MQNAANQQLEIPDLLRHIELGMQHLMNSLDADQDGIPFFGIRLTREGYWYLYHTPVFDVPHVIGRCLDALLYAETISRVQVPATFEEEMVRHFLPSFAESDHLNGFIDPSDGQRRVLFHNLREGLLGLNALVRYRHDEQARSLATNMLGTISHITALDGALDPEAVEALGVPGTYLGYKGPPPTVSGRFVGALVKYYRTSWDPIAIALADRFARYNLEQCFTSDGRLTDWAGAHVHSITGTIASAAALGILLNDGALIERARQIFDIGLWAVHTSFGWCKENWMNRLDMGEANNTGDLIQAALSFATWGYPDYYEIAEQMVRNHLLRSQIVDTSIFQENPDKEGDQYRNIGPRALGGFGFPTPNSLLETFDGWASIGQEPSITTLDITAGAVQALCEVYKAVISEDDSMLRVNLLFDRETDALTVQSWLPLEGRIKLTSHRRGNVFVRVPPWVDRNAISVRIGGATVPQQVHNSYLLICFEGAAQVAEIAWPLPRRTTREHANHKLYLVEWVGNHVVTISPSAETFPIYGSPRADADLPVA